MGGSSKKNTTYQTTNQQFNDQSYKDTSRQYEDSFNRDYSREYEDSFNNYSDHGAIKSAFDFSGDTVNRALAGNMETTRMNLDFSSDTVNRALGSVDKSIDQVVKQSIQSAANTTNNALSFAAGVVNNATAPGSDTAKYALIGAGLLGAALVLRK